MDIVLEWKGPFGLKTQEDRRKFSPPTASGVYLWTVANEIGPRVSYIGKAGNLAERFYQHVFWMLGGAYELLDDDHLLRGAKPVPNYRPSQDNLFRNFLDETKGLSLLARRNLLAYHFWWAPVPNVEHVLKAVESALIKGAWAREEPVQNDRVSLGEQRSPRIRVKSSFPAGSRITIFDEPIEYGVLEA
jgi:hypothetical protein